uniref:Uncharacterized protein n=1 Tax=Arundo donax TaxID=35708 RepID=A0A0A8YE50_ARUDO
MISKACMFFGPLQDTLPSCRALSKNCRLQQSHINHLFSSNQNTMQLDGHFQLQHMHQL